LGLKCIEPTSELFLGFAGPMNGALTRVGVRAALAARAACPPARRVSGPHGERSGEHRIEEEQ
jgi:hypothetical protein